jgi:hypothetical protein
VQNHLLDKCIDREEYLHFGNQRVLGGEREPEKWMKVAREQNF